MDISTRNYIYPFIENNDCTLRWYYYQRIGGFLSIMLAQTGYASECPVLGGRWEHLF